MNGTCRITFVLPRLGHSGGVRVVARYAEMLQRRGHQVTVVARPVAPARGAVGQMRKVFRWWGGEDRKRPPSHFDAVAVPVVMLDRYRSVRAEDLPDADILVATWWETAEWIAPVSPAKGSHVYLVQHDERMLCDKGEWARVEATWGLPMTRIVVAPWIGQLIMEHTGQSSTVIPNSVDSDLFYASPRDRGDCLTVGLMLSAARWKGADLAVEALRLAQRNIPELRVRAFGAASPARIASLVGGVANLAYQQLPDAAEIRSIYSSCDAWLFASRCEGFGLPILEAMACRTPVIATPAGAAPDLVPQGGGWMVPHENPAAMAAAITQLASLDPASWRERSEAALTVATAYSWEDATDRFERVLAEAVARCHAGAGASG